MYENDEVILQIVLISLIIFRISLTLACPMNLKLYPLDRQKCEMRIASCESKLIEKRVYVKFEFFVRILS